MNEKMYTNVCDFKMYVLKRFGESLLMVDFPNHLVTITCLTHKCRPFFLEAHDPNFFCRFSFLSRSLSGDAQRATAMRLMRCSPCKLHGEVRCLEMMRYFSLRVDRWHTY